MTGARRETSGILDESSRLPFNVNVGIRYHVLWINSLDQTPDLSATSTTKLVLPPGIFYLNPCCRTHHKLTLEHDSYVYKKLLVLI